MKKVTIFDQSEKYKAIWLTSRNSAIFPRVSTWGWETEDHEIAFINDDNTFDCSRCEEQVSLDDVDQWKIDEYYEVLADES